MREEVERHIRGCLGENGSIILRHYGVGEPKYNPAPADIAAAFFIVDDGQSLEALKKIVDWGDDLPVAIVSDYKRSFLDNIGLKLKHYLPLPPTGQDVREALRWMGLETYM